MNLGSLLNLELLLEIPKLPALGSKWYEAYQNGSQPQRLEWCSMLQSQGELWGFSTLQEMLVRGFLLLGGFLCSPSATCYQLPGKPLATVKESLVSL